MSYLSASAVVIHYEEALYQVYAPLPLPFIFVTTTSIVLISNEIQNGNILVTANPGSPEKWPLKRRERERERERERDRQTDKQTDRKTRLDCVKPR